MLKRRANFADYYVGRTNKFHNCDETVTTVNSYRDGSMKLGRVFLLLSIIAGLAASLPMVAMAGCEDLQERIHENRIHFEELEGAKGMFHEELHETPGAEQKHEIEMHIGDIEMHQNELNQQLGALEEEFSQCRRQQERNADHREKNGLPQGIIIAIIGAIGAVLAALIGLLRRR